MVNYEWLVLSFTKQEIQNKVEIILFFSPQSNLKS